MSIQNDQPSGDKNSAPVRAPRQSRLLKAVLIHDRLGPFDATLRNVSQTGIGGSCAHILTPGDRVSFVLPHHNAMRGTVRWVQQTRFGIAADQQIRLEALSIGYGGSLAPVDGGNEFRIIPPPKSDMRRPGLRLGAASEPGNGKSSWICDY